MEHLPQLPAYPRWRGLRVLALALVMLPALIASLPAAPARAPGFTLDLFDGTTFRLAASRGSPVVLLFWAPW